MKYDIILAGVGGQGVLSVSAIIASSAMKEGLFVKQSEVHGMSQRGGAVLANLRLASAPIASDLIPLGAASMILSMEPLESLRYLRYLSPDGAVITSTNPMVNIADYPELEGLLATGADAAAAPGSWTARQLARAAGSARATNMVMVGAASHLLPVQVATHRALHRVDLRGQGREGGRDEPEGVPRGARGGSMTIDAARIERVIAARRSTGGSAAGSAAVGRRRGPPRDRGPRTARRRSASARRRTCSCAIPPRPRRPTRPRSAATVSSSRSSRPIILHKSDVGGVKIVEHDREAIVAGHPRHGGAAGRPGDRRLHDQPVRALRRRRSAAS